MIWLKQPWNTPFVPKHSWDLRGFTSWGSQHSHPTSMPTAAVPAEVEKVPVFLHPLEEAKRCQPHTTSRVYLTEYTLWARFTYEKSPLLMGKRMISMAIFNSYVSHYQRVGLSVAWVCLKIWYHKTWMANQCQSPLSRWSGEIPRSYPQTWGKTNSSIKFGVFLSNWVPYGSHIIFLEQDGVCVRMWGSLL